MGLGEMGLGEMGGHPRTTGMQCKIIDLTVQVNRKFMLTTATTHKKTNPTHLPALESPVTI